MEVKTQENTKEISAIEQWDAVAFKLIQQELAPKGYSEIKRGLWRGKVRSNIPFLPKTSVVNCQKIAAQMVRTFRGKTLKELEELYDLTVKHSEECKKEAAECHFWQLRKKRECRKMAAEFWCHALGFSGAKHILNNIPIK